MSENLSIDEIIRQAEEIRKKTINQAKKAMEEADNAANEIIGKEIEVPKAEPEKITIKPKEEVKQYKPSSSKTMVVDTKAIKENETPTVDQKTKMVTLEQKTGVISDIKSVKKKGSYFESSGDEPQYSRKPPEIIERPATIKSKSRFDKTSDLEEIPTIVSVEELEHTKINLTREEVIAQREKEDYYEEDAQIVLEGFEDNTDEIEKIDEAIAEKQLEERRKDKVNKFRLFSPDDAEKDNPSQTKTVIKEEYESLSDADAFLNKLSDSRNATGIITIITTVFGCIIAYLTIFESTSYLPSFLLDGNAHLITLLVLYVLTLFANAKTLLHGLNFKGGMNYDFPVVVVNAVVLAHTILLLVNNDLLLDDGTAYPLAAVFALLMSNIGKLELLSRIIGNFKFITSKSDRYTVETIANKVDATIISRGLLSGESTLKTSIKTDFPTKYLDIACSNEPADGIAKKTGSIMLALNVVLFAVITILNHSWHIGLNVAVCGLCISAPIFAFFNTNSALTSVSKLLRSTKAMVNGFEGADFVNDANAIVMEAIDLFDHSSCEIHGIRCFNGAKADDVIIKTAAVITKTKSPLANVFDDVIIGKQSILPEVDGVVYEDKLGTSAWIYRKKILVGTRELLIHHGVDVLSEEEEAKYTRKGRKILYLAVTGKLMAMFVVSYNAEPELKRALKKLEKSGITIIIRSADPFINEESIARLFDLPDGYIRVMSTSNGNSFEKYSDMCVEKSPAYIVHDGTGLGFITAMSGAENLHETKKILNFLISFGSAIGFGVVALLAWAGGFSQLGAGSVVLFQILWCFFVELVSRIKRFGI